MKKLFLLLAFLSVITLSSCSSQNKELIVGKWQLTENPELVIEFTANGNAINHRTNSSGTYSVSGDKLSLSDGKQNDEAVIVEISEKQLITKAADGTTREWKRINN